MNAIRKWTAVAAASIALAAAGTIAAQEGSDQSVLPAVPALPLPDPGDDRSPSWREEPEGEASWGGRRNSRENWSERYGYGQRSYDGSPWNQYRQPRVGASRMAGEREGRRMQAMEAQAQNYQRLYWMMKAQIDAEQADR